jgi:8-oxo-dGTP pyrophosphatase MutT (NUDIX family)
MTDDIPVPVDSASILIIRDGKPHPHYGKLEVLMVKRNRNIQFAGGAYVFPGGKKDADDLLINNNLPPDFSHLLSTAYREMHEETGLSIENGTECIPFARWITPKSYSRRFDTRFFLISAPENQTPHPDGSEIVDLKWVKPLDFLNKHHNTMMYPTLMNLKLLGRATNCHDAFEQARVRKIIAIEPIIEHGIRKIDASSGYEDVDQNNILHGLDEEN